MKKAIIFFGIVYIASISFLFGIITKQRNEIQAQDAKIELLYNVPIDCSATCEIE